ncbi:unnamed protein product [Polarella glacialis]|uniref:N-acetyltransferase domain-containing protein n=2 Tax=Polarella glacialis TaxID=89957 RepID=A0A813L3D9_POLGL|nr:unnamed protein product [Polarella glacialis]
METLQVFVHYKHLFCYKERTILLHFYSNDKPFQSHLKKDRTEAGFVYFDAGSGALHGLHVDPAQRGRGLMKLLFLYYVLFCREFGLPARETAENKKPLFAKLYEQMGYKPACLDFPFLLSLRPSRADASPHTLISHVYPLPAENPRQAMEEGKASDKSWTFSPKFARSQGLVVEKDSAAFFAKAGEGNAVQLYAKTTWTLPDESSFLRREAILRELCGRARCTIYLEGR